MITASRHRTRAVQKIAVDPLELEVQAIQALDAQDEDAHWQIGKHFNAIKDERLATKAGFASLREFVAQRLPLLSYTQLRFYGQVAEAFAEPLAAHYGLSNLGLLLAYLSFKGKKLTDDPGTIPIQVPDKNGKVATKSFADCSYRDLRAALRQAKGGAVHPHSHLPSDDQRDVANLDAIDAAVTPFFAIKGEVIDDRTWVTFIRIPLNLMGDVIEALHGWKPTHPDDLRAARASGHKQRPTKVPMNRRRKRVRR